MILARVFNGKMAYLRANVTSTACSSELHCMLLSFLSMTAYTQTHTLTQAGVSWCSLYNGTAVPNVATYPAKKLKLTSTSNQYWQCQLMHDMIMSAKNWLPWAHHPQRLHAGVRYGKQGLVLRAIYVHVCKNRRTTSKCMPVLAFTNRRKTGAVVRQKSVQQILPRNSHSDPSLRLCTKVRL